MYSVKSNKRRKKGEEKEKKREENGKVGVMVLLYASIYPLFILNAVILCYKLFLWSMYIIKPYLYL